MQAIVFTVLCCFALCQQTRANATDVFHPTDSIELIDYYSNGHKKLEGFYYERIDGQGKILYAAVGKQIRYYENGAIQSYQYYKDGIPHGKFQSYTKAGTVEKTFFSIEGKLNGPYVYNYPDGAIKRVGTFKNDKDYGLSQDFYPDGTLMIEQYFNEAGIQEGEVKVYNKKGALIRQEILYDGKRKKR